jgi:hypothetical protein
MRRTSLALFLACPFLLLGGTLHAAQVQAGAKAKAKAAQDSLQYEVAVTVKLVQVYVTDSKGNPASDLEMSDFALYDNGKLQTITGFEKHFLSAPEGATRATPEVKVAEAKLAPGRDVTSLMNRKFIFLIDYGRNDIEGVAKSKNAALEFMNTKVQASDEVALFTF